MSSFLVSCKTLDYATAAAGLLEEYSPTIMPTISDRLELAKLNADGYRVRYSHIPEAVQEADRFYPEQAARVGFTPCPSVLHAYKALRCVLYQAMEGEVAESKPFEKWEGISARLAHRIASSACDAKDIPWDE